MDGLLAIYQGIPGDIAGMSFSRLDEVSDVNLDDIQPGTARRIRSEDIRCDSIQDARNLVNGYRQDTGNQHPAADAGNTDAEADNTAARSDAPDVDTEEGGDV